MTSQQGPSDRTVVRALLLAGSALVVGGAALPWFTVGGRTRSAFAIARSAQLLNLVDTPIRRAAVVVLFGTPMLASAVLIALSLRSRRVAAALGGTLGVIGLGTGAFGLSVSGTDRFGPMVTTIGGVLATVSAIWLVWRVTPRWPDTHEGASST